MALATAVGKPLTSKPSTPNQEEAKLSAVVVLYFFTTPHDRLGCLGTQGKFQLLLSTMFVVSLYQFEALEAWLPVARKNNLRYQ